MDKKTKHYRTISNKGTQNKIYDYIETHPGTHFREIQKKLNISWSTTRYYIHILEKQEKVISVKHKKFDYRLYWIKMQYNQLHPLIKHKISSTIELEIYQTIKKTPGIIQKQIIMQTQRKQTTIAYHLNKMRKNGTITYRKVGKTKRYYLIKKQ